MKKIIILSSFIMLFAIACKKDDTQKQQNNTNNDNITEIKTDMTPYKKALDLFQNPQYDLLYKLIEKGINAELEEDITIAYPKHARRFLNNDEQITIKKGATPLGIAALFCTPSLVNTLIDHGADLTKTVNGNSIAAIIIQCGEAEQTGMFENYLKAIRKYEKDNPQIYDNKPELYAANSTINIIVDGNIIPEQTILNYAVENKLNSAIPIILKYAGGINYFNNKNNSYNNLLPIVTAFENNNMEAARLFFEKTGSLFAQMVTLDGTKVSLIDYLFYNTMDEKIKKADIPVNNFFKSLVNGYKQSADGIAEIKQIIESGNLTNKLDKPLTTENGEITAGSTIAHIAAALEYNALLKGMAFYNDKTDILNIQDSNGDTPLHIAVRNGNLLTARILLEGGAYIDKTNDKGRTPLDVAVTEYNGKNQANIVKLLLTSSGKTINNYKINLDDETIEIYPDIKAVDDIFTKYNTEYRAFALSQSKKYVEELSPQVARILQGGIDNNLQFTLYWDETLTFPKGATPLIAASIVCFDNAVRNLILAKADTNIRITSYNDLKYNAYDFADRVAINDCTNVKEMLKNIELVKVDTQAFEEWSNEKVEENTKDHTTNKNTSEKNNDDEPYTIDTGDITDNSADNTNNDADVELIIEQ